MGRKESEKRINRVERMKDIENKREIISFFPWDSAYRVWKPFYRLSKWFPLMNINGKS